MTTDEAIHLPSLRLDLKFESAKSSKPNIHEQNENNSIFQPDCFVFVCFVFCHFPAANIKPWQQYLMLKSVHGNKASNW